MSQPGDSPFAPDVVPFGFALALRLEATSLVVAGVGRTSMLADIAKDMVVAAAAPAGGVPPAFEGLSWIAEEDLPGCIPEGALVILGPETDEVLAGRILAECGSRRDSLAGVVVASVSPGRLPEEVPGTIRLTDNEASRRMLVAAGFRPLLEGYSRYREDMAERAVGVFFAPAGALGRAWAEYESIDPPTAVAIFQCYNEIDIMPAAVHRLCAQGIRVHVMDNWSTDGTYEYLRDLAATTPQVVVERYPEDSSADYDMIVMLDRMDDIAATSDCDWAMHIDCDEFFESFSPEVSLRQGLGLFDRAGFDVVDFTVIDFRPTSAQTPGELPIDWEFGLRLGHRSIHRAWRKRGHRVGLSRHGGHVVPDPKRLAPVNFLLRHYPLRSPEHARRKIYRERMERYAKERTELGWHTQYDDYRADDPFLWDGLPLHRWEADTQREWMVEMTTRAGLDFRADRPTSPFAADRLAPQQEEPTGPGGSGQQQGGLRRLGQSAKARLRKSR